jgi:PDZ domain-containing protein
LTSPAASEEPAVKRRSAKAGIVAGVVLVLLVLGAVVRLPLFVLAPGSAISVAERVELGRPPDPLSGELLLTTVRVFPPTTFGLIRAWLSDTSEIFRREELVPAGVNDAEFEEAQRELFRESAEVAAAVGLRAAGEDVEISGQGALVAGLLPGGPAEGVLAEGDVITAVDGEPVAVASDLISVLGTRSPGDEVALAVRRDGTDQEIRLRLGTVEGLDQPAIGVAITTLDLDVSLPFPVDVDQGGIGGPSAGLLIALTVYDLADPGDLAAGRTIAGTGTIELDGDVGPVGGVDAKVVAAREAGASVFLVPAGELALAQSAAGDDIEIIPVATVEEAITALTEAA